MESVDMDEVDLSAANIDHQEPLLSSSVGHVEKKKEKVFSALVKWVLKIMLWSVTISWIILMFMLPLEWFHLKYEDWTEAAAGTLFGITDLRYNALSFIFLRIREVSWLQWHPFSISSSPLDGKDHFCVMIKVQGGWTTKLKDRICLDTQGYKLTASVEGPYGHELPYYITYEKLVLVAGGIGISPFLAILSDITHRIREEKPCLPRNILLVWAIKNTSELPLLSTLSSMDSNKINLHTLVYVTQQSQPPLVNSTSITTEETTTRAYVSNGNVHSSICNLVGTANSKWLPVYILSSTIGFVIIRALLDIYYVYALDEQPWWYKDLLLLASMVAAVVFFGGLVLGIWHLWEPKYADSDDHVIEEEEVICHSNGDSFRDRTNIHYGSRPNFRDILESLDEQWGHVDVGVIVCGPSSIESSVARDATL